MVRRPCHNSVNLFPACPFYWRKAGGDVQPEDFMPANEQKAELILALPPNGFILALSVIPTVHFSHPHLRSLLLSQQVCQLAVHRLLSVTSAVSFGENNAAGAGAPYRR